MSHIQVEDIPSEDIQSFSIPYIDISLLTSTVIFIYLGLKHKFR